MVGYKTILLAMVSSICLSMSHVYCMFYTRLSGPIWRYAECRDAWKKAADFDVNPKVYCFGNKGGREYGVINARWPRSPYRVLFSKNDGLCVLTAQEKLRKNHSLFHPFTFQTAPTLLSAEVRTPDRSNYTCQKSRKLSWKLTSV